jgi:hypothetical protein
MHTNCSTLRILGLVAVIAGLSATWQRAEAQAVSSFKASIEGVGLQFKYSPTQNGTYTDINSQINKVGLLPANGYYQIGFAGLPPAYIAMEGSGSSLGVPGQILAINAIRAIYLFDATGFAVDPTETKNANLYYSPTNPNYPHNPSSYTWGDTVEKGSPECYVGYCNTTNTGFNTGTLGPVGTTLNPDYGQFYFGGNWKGVTGSHVYFAMDVQAYNPYDKTRVMNTGRIYLDGYNPLIPEPAFYQLGGLAAFGAFGSIVYRRRCRRSA